MKKLILIVMLLFIAPHAFALNPVEANVKVKINKPPEINMTEFEKVDGSVATEGEEIEISVIATDPNGDTLLYKFIINGVVKRDWNVSHIFRYRPGENDRGVNDIVAEVKDDLATVSTYDPNKKVEIYVLRNTLALPQ